MKTKPPKKPVQQSIRDQVIAAMLSETARQVVRVIGTIVIYVILRQDAPADLVPQLLLV